MKKTIVFISLFLVCAYSQAKQYYFRNDLTIDANNSYKWDQGREKLILPFHKDKVERDSGVLIIKSIGKVLKDNLSEGDNSIAYTFVDINKAANCLVVSIQYYEGGEYELINYKNGYTVETNGIPIWSPSSKRFAVVYLDLLSHYIPNTLQIWRVKNGQFIKEWEIPGIGADKVVWESEDYVKIRTAISSLHHEIEYKVLYCKFKGDTWSYSDKE